LDQIAASVIKRQFDATAPTPLGRGHGVNSPGAENPAPAVASAFTNKKAHDIALLQYFWLTWAGIALSTRAKKAETPQKEFPAMISMLALKRDSGSQAKLDTLHELELRIAPCWGDLVDNAAATGIGGEESLLQLSPLTPSLGSGMSHLSTCHSDLSSLPSPLMPPPSLSDTRPLASVAGAYASHECSTDAEAPLHLQLRTGAQCQHAAVLSYRLLQKERQCAALREALSHTGHPSRGPGSSSENLRDGGKMSRSRQAIVEGADACKLDASRTLQRIPFASCENII